jgi:hypothetical protein
MWGRKPYFGGCTHRKNNNTKVKGKGFFEIGFRIVDFGKRNNSGLLGLKSFL